MEPVGCPAGQLGDQTGLASAECAGPCPPGSFCPEGATAAEPCPEATYNPTNGSGSSGACLPTPAAYLSAEGSCFYCEGSSFCSMPTAALECVCAEGFFHAQPGGALCSPCPAGATCDDAGTTLATMDVRPNFWRPGETSADGKACPYAHTCAGGAAAPPRYDAVSTATCVAGRGLSGVFCTLCANASATEGGTYYFHVSRERCEACAEQPLSLLLGLIFGVGGAAVACALARCWLRARRREWWQRRVEEGRRAWRRVADVRPTFKIVFSFCAARGVEPFSLPSSPPRRPHG